MLTSSMLNILLVGMTMGLLVDEGASGGLVDAGAMGLVDGGAPHRHISCDECMHEMHHFG